MAIVDGDLKVEGIINASSASISSLNAIQEIAAGGVSQISGSLQFGNGGGVSFGLNAGTITATVVTNYLTTAALSDHSHGNPQLNLTNLTGTTASNSAGFTLSLSGNAAQTVQTQSLIAALYDGANSISTGTARFSNSNGISFGINGQTVTASHDGLTSQSNQNVTAGNGGFAFQTLSFSNANGFSFGTSAGSAITGSYTTPTQTNQQMTMFATGNTTLSSTGTSNASSLIFRGSGAASVGITNGSILIDVAAGAAAITQSFGISTHTAGGATGGTSGYATGDDILYHFVPGSNITMSQSLNGASATLSIYGPAGGGTISKWANMYDPSVASALTSGSVSYAVSFNLPYAVSASFMRIPILMTTGSTTLATLASATATASNSIMSTFNAVVYSMGVGASSRSLQSVASGSAGFTWQNSISITNSTQYSISQRYSAQVEGGGTTLTTQYSISNTNYSFTTNVMQTAFSSVRWLDVPFANSLSAGHYWLIYGYSTSSASAGAVAAGMSACRAAISAHYVGTHIAAISAAGHMGSTDLSSGANAGGAQFSTAGGGTTNSLNISALTAHSNLLYFQLKREA